jgi:hypothetical protein
MHPATMNALLALQLFNVLFLSLHDWVPLGTLNDVKAVRGSKSGRQTSCQHAYQRGSICARPCCERALSR